MPLEECKALSDESTDQTSPHCLKYCNCLPQPKCSTGPKDLAGLMVGLVLLLSMGNLTHEMSVEECMALSNGPKETHGRSGPAFIHG